MLLFSPKTRSLISRALLGAWLSISVSGCSLFIGNIRPVEDKSDQYEVLDLARDNPDWTRLETQTDASRTDISDLAFQSKSTQSVISLNSSCRPVRPVSDLSEFTRQLLLGITDVTERSEQTIQIAGKPALETTIQGRVNGNIAKLRTAVLVVENCVYDLMLIAQPEAFQKNESDFSRFIGSLRLN